jgi:hypothetical protein
MGIWAARPFVISYGAQRLFRHVAGCDTCMLMPLCIFSTSHLPKHENQKAGLGFKNMPLLSEKWPSYDA